VNYASLPASYRAAEPPSAPSALGAMASDAAELRRASKETPVVLSSSDAAGRLLGAIARERSTEAFGELFDRYAGRLKHFFVRGGIPAERAEELTQDVLLAVWRRADSFDASRSSALTWIYALARNRRIDEYRLQGHAAPRAEDLAWDVTDGCSTEGAFEDAHRQQALREALVTLPPEQRAVLVRTFFDGLSLAEVASDSGLPLGTVKSRARLALERLRRVLRSPGEAS
jgi:RNA polymerase sigma factor (sigma-70 family)